MNIVAMAMDRDKTGRLVVRHDGRDTIALNYPAGPGYNVTTLIEPGKTVALDAFETSRNPEEDARLDEHWIQQAAQQADHQRGSPPGADRGRPPGVRGQAGPARRGRERPAPLAGPGAAGNLLPPGRGDRGGNSR